MTRQLQYVSILKNPPEILSDKYKCQFLKIMVWGQAKKGSLGKEYL